MSAAVLLGPAVTPALAESCPNAQFRVGPSAALPDCRAYEQITPVNKEASNDMFLNLTAPSGLGSEGFAADQGDKVLLSTSAAFGPNPDGFRLIDYVFSRSSGDWQLTPIEPPGAGDAHYAVSGAEAFQHGVFSPDVALVAPLSESGSAGSLSSSTPMNLWFGAPGGPYSPIATTTLGDHPGFSAATPDFSHIFFTTRDHSLAAPAAGLLPGSDALYEWTDGHIRLVNVKTDGSLTSPCGAAFGASGGNTAGVSQGFGSTHDAVSSDGSRVFFVSPEPGPLGLSDSSCSQPSQLYMREAATNTTVPVSCPPNVPDPNGCQGAAFVGASADGSRVFFATKTELTADDTTHDFELYEYDTGSGTLTRVSRGASGDADGDVQWALVSEDGSMVYFAAVGQLAPGAPALTPPSAGGTQVNLYRYDTATGTTRYIATVKGSDGPEQPRYFQGAPLNSFGGPFQTGFNTDSWYTTPNGRFLLFGSSADLTGYDPGSSCVNNFGTAGVCQELYRYDASAGSLTCVSCPGTSPAAGSALFVVGNGGWADVRPPRGMSDDGSRVFFDTRDALLPQDANGRYDVYEWEADGAGSCDSSAQSGGCLYLISSGTDPTDSIFVDASADGSNAFFGTHAQLAATDTDLEGDLYDARVDGGFPAPPGPVSCSGDACQGQASSAPLLASVTFFGPGNASAGAGTTPRVRVLSRVVHGSTFVLRVKVPGKGRVTITGKGIRRVSRTVARAGTYRLKVTLTPKEKRALTHKRKLTLRLRVGYAPAGGRASAATVRLTVEPAVKHKRPSKARRTSPSRGGGAR